MSIRRLRIGRPIGSRLWESGVSKSSKIVERSATKPKAARRAQDMKRRKSVVTRCTIVQAKKGLEIIIRARNLLIRARTSGERNC